MLVNRIDLLDFKVVLTTNEFNQVKDISDCEGIGIEQAFANSLEAGLYVEEQYAKGKES